MKIEVHKQFESTLYEFFQGFPPDISDSKFGIFLDYLEENGELYIYLRSQFPLTIYISPVPFVESKWYKTHSVRITNRKQIERLGDYEKNSGWPSFDNALKAMLSGVDNQDFGYISF